MSMLRLRCALGAGYAALVRGGDRHVGSETMTVSEQLRAARALIEDPGHWTQEASARDSRGFPVNISDAHATQWCALGACVRVGLSLDPHVIGATLAEWLTINEREGHAAVLAMFDRVIARSEAEEVAA